MTVLCSSKIFHQHPNRPLSHCCIQTRDRLCIWTTALSSLSALPARGPKRLAESEMVRHEAAEALGGIGTPEVLPHLREWMIREDAPRVVRESCQVAIDMWEVVCFAP